MVAGISIEVGLVSVLSTEDGRVLEKIARSGDVGWRSARRMERGPRGESGAPAIASGKCRDGIESVLEGRRMEDLVPGCTGMRGTVRVDVVESR